MDLISVIIPVYNVAPYLRECLDSVIHQTYTDIEVLLIDDGSTDESGAICDAYAAEDSRITVIHKKNEGQGKARNIGMDMAQGKYIYFLDSDDYIDLHAFEILTAEAEKNDLQILQFSMRSFLDGDVDTNRWKEKVHVFKAQNGEVKNGADHLAYEQKNGEYSMLISRRFYRRDYLESMSLRFPEGYIHEDESFAFLARINAKRIESIGDVLFHHRFRPGSTMTAKNYWRSFCGYAAALNEVLSAYMQLDSQEVAAKKKELFAKIMRDLFGAVCDNYAGVIHEWRPDTGEISSEVVRDVQNLLKKARGQIPGLPRTRRLCAENLYWGCRISRVYYGLRHCAGELKRKLLRGQ